MNEKYVYKKWTTSTKFSATTQQVKPTWNEKVTTPLDKLNKKEIHKKIIYPTSNILKIIKFHNGH